MGVFTFISKGFSDEWSTKQLNDDLDASTNCTFDLQLQVIVGGSVGGGGYIGSGATSAPAVSGSGAATEAPPAEE
ncbi:hypothetical protein DH2020_020142 [Rehmannia glutinosa]|uniref:Uncharacterized protein n=1 Tax=Rehmannia glutinosa TaxID=99300 RepID=A0ABR0WF90_REHGL